MDNWPLSLQQILNADDFEIKFGSTVVRSDMDVGPAKVRSRYTDGVDQYSASILLTFSEYTTFRDFFKTTLNNGTLPFLFDDPMTGVSTAFRFVDPPTISPLGGLTFRVSMSWEKLP
jgi:hypothetical protein